MQGCARLWLEPQVCHGAREISHKLRELMTPGSEGGRGQLTLTRQPSVQQRLSEILKSFQRGYISSICPEVWAKCFPFIFLLFQEKKNKRLYNF